MKIRYEDWNPGPEASAIITQANAICEEYVAQGYDLTLRQLYYQFVARDIIPNNLQSYNRLGHFINKGRLAGLVDWDHIVDRTRNLSGSEHFAKPQDAIYKASRSFSMDLWRNQPLRVEVWVEKEALAGVVGRVAQRNDVDYFSCRGYVSQSELWSAGQRLLGYIEGGQRVVILHLGDHDPSGIDMTRDITERLENFIWTDWHRRTGRSMAPLVGDEGPLEVRRIALNMAQVTQYEPPPNPAKITDSRAASYMEKYGNESWELDALEPQVLDQLIEGHILVERDDEVWERTVREEEEARMSMVRVADHWPSVLRTAGVVK